MWHAGEERRRERRRRSGRILDPLLSLSRSRFALTSLIMSTGERERETVPTLRYKSKYRGAIDSLKEDEDGKGGRIT